MEGTWYQLVDAQGAPLEGSQPSAVSLAANAMVFQLQDAVRAKDDNAFPTVIASQLRVFYNEQDARANTSALAPNDVVPWSSSSTLLFVVVPSEPGSVPDRRVWYQLADDQGVLLEGMESSEVSVVANAIVVQLKDAVRAQNGSAFPTVGASQLKVFTNGRDVRDSSGALAPNAIVPPTTPASPLLVVVPSEPGKVKSGQLDVGSHPVVQLPDVQMTEYRLSELNSEHVYSIKLKLRLQSRHFNPHETPDTSVEGYKWRLVEETHAIQRASYMAYLREKLKPLLHDKVFELIDVADDGSLLSIVDPRLPFGLTGTTDVLLSERSEAQSRGDKLAGVRLVIEVKKTVESSNVPEALGQLVTSSLKANEGDYPMSLLTDLNDWWYFSWFNDGHLLASLTLKYPKNAIDFILACMTKQDDAGSFDVPFVGQPLKKLKIEDFI